MPLSIDLGDLVPENTPPPPPSAEIEIFLQALESERGIAISFESRKKAEGYRFKLYQVRTAERKHGNFLFDGLTIALEGTRVLIRKPEPMKVEPL